MSTLQKEQRFSLGKLAALGLLASLFSFTNCASKLRVVEVEKELETPLSQFPKALLSVSTEKPENKHYLVPMAKRMQKRFRQTKIFSEIHIKRESVKRNADVWIKLKLIGKTEYTARNFLGIKDFVIFVEMIDLKSNDVIHSFKVRGFSGRKRARNISGQPMAWFDDDLGNALASAGELILHHLKQVPH